MVSIGQHEKMPMSRQLDHKTEVSVDHTDFIFY